MNRSWRLRYIYATNDKNMKNNRLNQKKQTEVSKK